MAYFQFESFTFYICTIITTCYWAVFNVAFLSLALHFVDISSELSTFRVVISLILSSSKCPCLVFVLFHKFSAQPIHFRYVQLCTIFTFGLDHFLYHKANFHYWLSAKCVLIMLWVSMPRKVYALLFKLFTCNSL